jgi:Cu+-exporting ATPase
MARDPVCGMMVDPAKAAAHAEHKGETYYFCAKGCAQKFAANPERYLKPAPMIPAIAPAMVTTIQTAPAALPTNAPPARSKSLHRCILK